MKSKIICLFFIFLYSFSGNLEGAEQDPQLQIVISAKQKTIKNNEVINIHAKVENLSSAPYTYTKWLCPPNAEFAILSDCLTHGEAYGGDCDANGQITKTIKKSDPYEIDIPIKQKDTCKVKNTKLKIQIGIYKEVKKGHYDYFPTATSNELSFKLIHDANYISAPTGGMRRKSVHYGH